MLLPAICTHPAEKREGLGDLRPAKILTNIQVEWFVVKLFDSSYNVIVIYHLQALLVPFALNSTIFRWVPAVVSPYFSAIFGKLQFTRCATPRFRAATNLVR